MATLLAGQNVTPVYQSGPADSVGLFALKNVTTGDTIDMSQWFQVIDRCVIMGVTAFVEIAGSFSGTVVTMPTGLSHDAGYMLIWGSPN